MDVRPKGKPRRARHGLIVDEVEAQDIKTAINKGSREVMSDADVTRMLAAETMAAWSHTSNEAARNALNWRRAPALVEHYRLGADNPDNRVLHRRAQVQEEHYREVQTGMHAINRTSGEDARESTLETFQQRSLAAEETLHQHGHIYDPVGVEQRAGGVGHGFGHDMQSNFAWLLGAIHAGHNFDLVGPLSDRSLTRGSKPRLPSPEAEPSALLREVQALTAPSVGYTVGGSASQKGVPIIPIAAPRMPKGSVTMSDLNEAAPALIPGDAAQQALRDQGLLRPNIDNEPESARLGAVRTMSQSFRKNPQLQQTFHDGTKVARGATISSFLRPPQQRNPVVASAPQRLPQPPRGKRSTALMSAVKAASSNSKTKPKNHDK